jgi:CRISPR-associated endonuclease/helicase Cas3
MKSFLAKSNPPESIQQHTQKLLEAFELLLQYYESNFSPVECGIIRLAAKYHDFGKANFFFQNKLLEMINEQPLNNPEISLGYQKQKEIPHGYLSPAFLPLEEIRHQYDGIWVFSLINAIFYHHTREIFPDSDICNVIDFDLIPRLGNEFKIQKKYLSICAKKENPPNLVEWEHYAIIKGTLNRLDYAASSGGELLIELDPHQNEKKIDQYIEEKIAERWKLRDVQIYMKNNRDKNLVVIASTGIGKTEAALLWGGDSKLFYTLPLKVSINAIYRRISDIKNGYGWKNCTLLHSDALSFLLKEETETETDPLIKYQRARFFAYPLTVCTVDQLFTFVYRYLGSEIIPSVLKYSKVVVDEIQSYSPDIVARLLFGLKVITDLGGKFAIITATFPPILKVFLHNQGIPCEFSEPFLLQQQRHWIEYFKKDFDDDEIALEGTQKKVLVLCNTVKKACEMYNRIREITNFPVHLLHSRFQKRHRDLLENAIQVFSQEEDAIGIWISTQIVEASLDIDFDILFTEMCPADNLLQRLGRCYRKRDYEGKKPNVLIYDTGSGVGTVYPDKDIYNFSVDYLQEYCGRIFTEQDKQNYIEKVYSIESLRPTNYFRKITMELNTLQQIPFAYFSKDEAKEKFRGIISYSVIPEEQYNDLLKNGERDVLLSKLHNRKLDEKERAKAKEKLMSYTIAVDSRYLNFIDKTPIDQMNQIFRINLAYDFHEDSLSGIGLMDKQGQNFII